MNRADPMKFKVALKLLEIRIRYNLLDTHDRALEPPTHIRSTYTNFELQFRRTVWEEKVKNNKDTIEYLKLLKEHTKQHDTLVEGLMVLFQKDQRVFTNLNKIELKIAEHLAQYHRGESVFRGASDLKMHEDRITECSTEEPKYEVLKYYENTFDSIFQKITTAQEMYDAFQQEIVTKVLKGYHPQTD